MCVKDYKGYSCGHCTVPIIHQCPMAGQNDRFPICQFQAERPEFTQEMCPGCTRVAWNEEVLKNEKEHRGLHERGLCSCGFDFTPEERWRRAASNREKGRGWGIMQINESGTPTRQIILQPGNGFQEPYWDGEDRQGSRQPYEGLDHMKQTYQTQARPFSHHPIHQVPNYRPFIAARMHMRWHPWGEQSSGTLHDGSIPTAGVVATPEMQPVRPEWSVQQGTTRQARHSNNPLANGMFVQESPVDEWISSVEQAREKPLDTPLNIPVSSKSVKGRVVYPIRPHSSPR